MADPNAPLLLGLDYGSDSVRALFVDARSGEALAEGTATYPRWESGRYCDPTRRQYRQHPLDYLESLRQAVAAARERLPHGTDGLAGIGIATTGSTPCAIDKSGTPLALLEEFSEDPTAMFNLWKDHSAIAEAEEIVAAARSAGTDYTRYCGGSYSSEWFWAKLLRTLREGGPAAQATAGWVEHCDWLPWYLGGARGTIPRGRCAAGHKAMWHADWGGYPPTAFWENLEAGCAGIAAGLPRATVENGSVVAHLSEHWARELGLPAGTPLATGVLDAHLGAVGAGIRPGQLSKVIGTSTCDLAVVKANDLAGGVLDGIAGQVDGSILPGYVGLEAGQSAFGDVYAWLQRTLSWVGAPSDDLLDRLAAAAPPRTEVVATDWFNGRRSPDPDQRLRGSLSQLDLSTTPPELFRALVEATCFGSRAIMERIEGSGVSVDSIVASGGIAQKSAFVMQTLANCVGRPIVVAEGTQTVARGAALNAAVAAGIFPDFASAADTLAAKPGRRYLPETDHTAYYERKYQRYRAIG